MLELSRKLKQSIVIWTKDGPITVRILRSSASRVTLGIEAPQSCNIVRSELKDVLD